MQLRPIVMCHSRVGTHQCLRRASTFMRSALTLTKFNCVKLNFNSKRFNGPIVRIPDSWEPGTARAAPRP